MGSDTFFLLISIHSLDLSSWATGPYFARCFHGPHFSHTTELIKLPPNSVRFMP